MKTHVKEVIPAMNIIRLHKLILLPNVKFICYNRIQKVNLNTDKCKMNFHIRLN